MLAIDSRGLRSHDRKVVGNELVGLYRVYNQHGHALDFTILVVRASYGVQGCVHFSGGGVMLTKHFQEAMQLGCLRRI